MNNLLIFLLFAMCISAMVSQKEIIDSQKVEINDLNSELSIKIKAIRKYLPIAIKCNSEH